VAIPLVIDFRSGCDVDRVTLDRMGDRRVRALTRQFVDAKLVELTKPPSTGDTIDDEALAEWSDHGPVARGSQGAVLPVTSRTTTLADPMTTSLLAEVARRTTTVEIDPSVIEALCGRTKPHTKPRG
jgi:hypothetical protein